MALKISSRIAGAVMQVRISGRMDALEAPLFEQKLMVMQEGISAIELDFADLDYISSAGLRSLVLIKKQAMTRDIKLIIKDPQQSVREVFAATGLGKVLGIASTEQKTVASGPADGFYPLRPIQRWLVDTHFRKADSTMMNNGALLKLDASVDLEQLADAVNDVLESYDIFRCRLHFHPDTGELCQRFDGRVSKVRVEILSEMLFAQRKQDLEKPFTLIDRPLYRVYLMKTPSGKYIYADFYHAIMDGTAIVVLFWREVNKRYQHRPAKRKPASYADFVWAEAQNLLSGQEDGHRYWREMLAGFNPQKHLPPVDIRRKERWQEGVFDCELQDIRHDFFANRPYSETTFFLAVSMMAMVCVTGSKDVIMSWVHNARTSVKEMRLMGLMLNQYPIRWDFGEDMSILRFLTALEAKIQEGIENARSLDVVYQEDLEGECASFILQKDTDTKAAYMLDGMPCTIEERPVNKRSAAENVLDIAVTALADGGYFLTLAYDASRYSKAAMVNYGEAFVEMMQDMQADERLLSEILP